MSGAKVIQDDEAYERARIAILEMANKLDDPLSFTDDEHKRMMMIYDRTTDLMRFYRRGELVRMFPGLRETYASIGWKWQELDVQPKDEPILEPQQEEVINAPPMPEEPPKQPEEPQTSKPKKNMMAWLDD